MANSIIVMGKSGSGKSSAIKTLNPESTYIINVLNKVLPFKGSKSLYNKDKKNLSSVDNHLAIVNTLKAISEKAPHIKNIIIDDAIYIMRKEFFDRASEKGYDKYTELAVHFKNIIETCQKLRDDLNVFLLLHTEDVKNGDFISTQKVSTIGSLLDRQYNPIENVSILLFAQPKFDDKGNPIYGFYTNKVLINGVEINSKTPESMFDELFIPNDFQLVVNKIEEYFN